MGRAPSCSAVLCPTTAGARCTRRWGAGGTTTTAGLRTKPATWSDFYTGNVSVPRTATKSAGGFDAALHYGEDVELGYRLAQLGLRFVYAPAAAARTPNPKPARALLRDFYRSGQGSVAIYHKHPGALRALPLAAYGETNIRLRLARGLLLGLSALPGLGRLIDLAFALWAEGPRAGARVGLFELARAVYYWRGVRATVRDRAEWARLASPGVPILLYHSVEPARPGHVERYCVDTETFARQMALLRRLGYRVEALASLAETWDAGGLPEPRTAAISFDDGYRNNLTEAWPVLQRHAYPATLFLVTGSAGGQSTWDPATEEGPRPFITWDEARTLDRSGFQVEAHTVTHPDLTTDSSRRSGSRARRLAARTGGGARAPGQPGCLPLRPGESDGGAPDGRGGLHDGLFGAGRPEYAAHGPLRPPAGGDPRRREHSHVRAAAVDRPGPLPLLAGRHVAGPPGRASGHPMSTAGPTVAVVIPTMERPAILAACLAAVHAGTRLPDAIIVVDQSRTPGARAATAAACADRPGVVYRHLAQPNASAARNAGLAMAQTVLVAYLDDDCLPERDWLTALVGEYESTAAIEPVAAVTGSVVPRFAPGRQVPVSSRQGGVRRVFRAGDGSLARGAWAPWDVGTGANILAPRAALAAVSGFDPALGPGTPAHAAEDVDLLYRLAPHGALIYQPAARVGHPAGTRRDHLQSRFRYGAGMGAMLGRHVAAGDRTARRLLSLYLRHRLRNLFRWRHGIWSPLSATLVLAGAATGLAQVWRGAGRGRPAGALPSVPAGEPEGEDEEESRPVRRRTP